MSGRRSLLATTLLSLPSSLNSRSSDGGGGGGGGVIMSVLLMYCSDNDLESEITLTDQILLGKLQWQVKIHI